MKISSFEFIWQIFGVKETWLWNLVYHYLVVWFSSKWHLVWTTFIFSAELPGKIITGLWGFHIWNTCRGTSWYGESQGSAMLWIHAEAILSSSRIVTLGCASFGPSGALWNCVDKSFTTGIRICCWHLGASRMEMLWKSCNIHNTHHNTLWPKY